MATVNYSWATPTVGGSEDTWGDDLLANWASLDTLLGGVNATEFARLDGLTASTAELNKLDGVTATTTELNRIAGLTASTSELNKLDGVTVSTAEINRLGGVTSGIQAQINKKAPIASPTFTGGPRAPTPDSASSSTLIATTKFVKDQELTPSQVAAKIASVGVGDVGTYAFLRHESSTDAVDPGDTVTGSNFRYSDGNFSKSAGSPSGTWRCMGYAPNRSYPTLYLRIS